MAGVSRGLLGQLSRGDLDTFQSRRQRWEEVGRDLVAAAWTEVIPESRDWDGASRFYLEKYLFLTKPTVLRRLANLMSELVDERVERLAGREQGALSLLSALALETGLPFVIIRGLDASRPVAVGELNPDENILVVEDVVSSGTQASGAVAAVTATGAQVTDVLAVVDRGEGGAARLEEESVALRALFAVTDLPLPTVHPPSCEQHEREVKP